MLRGDRRPRTVAACFSRSTSSHGEARRFRVFEGDAYWKQMDLHAPNSTLVNMNHDMTVGRVSPRQRPFPPQAGSGQYPLARLLQIVMHLQAERCPNARELAEACEVSRRTIYRDFSTLAAAGISVHYVPDRQGYELARNIFLQPTRLHEREALALLLFSRCWDGAGATGLLRQARTAVDKVLQGLPPDLRATVGNCSELLPEVPEIDDESDGRHVLLEGVLAAMTRRRQIRLWYRDQGSREAEAETTKFSLYRLPRINGEWTLVGRSSYHRRVVPVPLDWVERIEPTTDTYVVPPRFHLKRFLDQGRGRAEAESPGEIILRLRGGLAGRIEELPWKCRRRWIGPDQAGVELAVEAAPGDHLPALLLSMGDELEVVSPQSLRDEVGELAARVARRYRAGEAATANGSRIAQPPGSGGVGG